MAPANALSQRDDIDTSLDNMDVQLLPSDALNLQIQAINMALVDKIRNSSFSDLLVLQTVHQMEKELPLFNRSCAKHSIFDNGWLYFKHCLYIPKVAHYDLVATTHGFFKRGLGGHLQTIALLSKDYWWPSLSIYYRCLGPPIFFPHPILPAVPLPMGHDNQQQRDLLGDLGPVCRWQYSEHHLLKRLSPLPLSSPIFFLFWTYLYHCQHDYTLHCFTSSHLYSHVSMIDSSFPSHNHAYSYVSFLLTLIDIASMAMLSLCTAL